MKIEAFNPLCAHASDGRLKRIDVRLIIVPSNPEDHDRLAAFLKEAPATTAIPAHDGDVLQLDLSFAKPMVVKPEPAAGNLTIEEHIELLRDELRTKGRLLGHLLDERWEQQRAASAAKA